MKKLILSLFAVLAAVSSEAASYTIKHADGTTASTATTLTAALKKTFEDGDIIVVGSGETTSVTTQKPAFNPGSDVTVTLDLNGQTLSRSSSNTTDPVFAVKSGTLILTDSSNSGNATISAGRAGRPAITVSGGKLVVEKVAIIGMGTTSASCIIVTGGDVEILSGSFSKGLYNIACTSASSTITIADGEFGGAGTSVVQSCDGMTLNISGGKFAQTVGATITTVSGGLFATQDHESLVKNVDVSTNRAYPWTASATVEDPLFHIDGASDRSRDYAKIADLNADLQDGDTIKLLKDLKLNIGISASSGKIVVDLNGHTYETTGDNPVIVVGGAAVTLTDTIGGGKVLAPSKNGVVRIGSGSFTLDGVEVRSNGETPYTAIDLNAAQNTAEVAIKSGVVYGDPAINFAAAKGTMTIAGGEISAPKTAMEIKAGNQLVISGGDLTAVRGLDLLSGYATPFILLTGGKIRAVSNGSGTTPGAIFAQFGTSSIIIDGMTLDATEGAAIQIGNASSLLSVCSGAIKSNTICDVAEENADEYRKFITGGYFTDKPATGYIKKGYQAVANTDANSSEYPWKVVAKATIEEPGVTEIKLPDSFTGALTIPATMNAVKVPENTTLKVIGTSGAEITKYVTTAADSDGVIKIDLDPAKVDEPEVSEMKLGDEEGGVAIPESIPGLTYQLLGGTSLDSIVDVHDVKTGTGEKLDLTPDAEKLEGASPAFFRVRVVK